MSGGKKRRKTRIRTEFCEVLTWHKPWSKSVLQLFLVLSPNISVHIGDGDTTILAERGFRFVDPYVEKTVIHFDGNKMHLLPAQINTKKVVFGVLETHRVSDSRAFSHMA